MSLNGSRPGPLAYELLTVIPVIENGHIRVMSGPGWRSDVKDDAVKELLPIEKEAGPR
jgi:L-alanine-DL-glutamate epimerase-like enolase superfamily enzyme